MKKALFSLLIAIITASLSLVPVYAIDTQDFDLDASGDDVVVDSLTFTQEEEEQNNQNVTLIFSNENESNENTDEFTINAGNSENIDLTVDVSDNDSDDGTTTLNITDTVLTPDGSSSPGDEQDIQINNTNLEANDDDIEINSLNFNQDEENFDDDLTLISSEDSEENEDGNQNEDDFTIGDGDTENFTITTGDNNSGADLNLDANDLTISTSTLQASTSTDPALIDDETIDSTIERILQYFKSQQDETGQIIDGPTSDWLVMSFGATDVYGQDVNEQGKSLFEYMETYDLSDPAMELNICASYPRHYLALRATGMEDNSLIERISAECFENDVFGQQGINDDVFGLFALLASGESTDSAHVQTILTTILADQTTDGAFTWDGYASADITGAVMNVLTYAQEKGASLDEKIYDDAIDYLKTNQLTDGGWGYEISDILTTSWAMMGLNARNEIQENWMTSENKSPWHVMVNNVTNEGYYESTWVPGTIDWFATKHAVPALAGSSWPIILKTVGNTITPPPGSSTGSYNPQPQQTTTTLDITTSTVDIVTSTTDIVTSTDNTVPEKITTTTAHLDAIDLWLLEQERLASEGPTKSVPTEVLGAKIEQVTITPDSNNLTPTEVVEIKTLDEEEMEEDVDLSIPETDETNEEMGNEEKVEESIIDMKDVRNIIITIIVFVLGYSALKFFKILV